jgi:S-adenosylmethionine synthetase
VAYAIGVAKPVGVHINTFGTGKVPDAKLAAYIIQNFDMRPRAIVEELDLLRPIYSPTSAYGHFGRPEFTWEKTDRAAELADAFSGGSAKSVASSRASSANGSREKNGRAEKAVANGATGKAKPAAGRRAARAQA